MKNIKYYINLLSLSLFLCCTSCSEDNIEPLAENNDMFKVTLNIGGLEGVSGTTRAGENSDWREKYTTYMYVFRNKKNPNVEDDPTDVTVQATSNPFADYMLYSYKGNVKTKIENERIELNLHIDYNYLFVFIASESVYENEGKVLVYNPEGTGNAEVKENDKYINCYIQAVDESKWSAVGDGMNVPVYEKASGSDSPFMIYGAGLALPGFQEDEADSYIPETIVLKRQMGAVTFKVPEGTKIDNDVTCSILTDYYRLYLSQIIEANQSGTLNHVQDYASNVGDSYAPVISCTFTAGETDTPGEYTVYLPCTTTHSEVSIDSEEQANYIRDTGNNWKPYVPQYISTSMKWGNKAYVLSGTCFPVFPNRRTILHLSNGDDVGVSFTDMDGTSDQIDVEDDWNGMD